MPKRRLRPEKHPQISKAEKQNLDHFGCAFRERTGVFYIDWRGKTADQASRADIFARLGSLETKAGPLLLLAFEISVLRPLPSYCYFPFDLTNQVHQKYLAQLTQSGETRLCFVVGKRVLYRSHQLAAYERLRAAELYDEAKQSLEKYGTSVYEFESAVRLLERGVRIPELVERLISDKDFSEILKHIKQAVQTVPAQKLELARQIVQEALRSLQPYFEKNKNSELVQHA